MNEKIITVDHSDVAAKDDKEWIWLFDKEGKKHGIFKKIRDEEGNWYEFPKDKFDALRDCSGRAVKLFRVKNDKGFYTPVDAEFVENVFVKEAQRQVEVSTEPSGQETGMCMKEIGESMRTGTLTKIFGEADAKLLWDAYKLKIFFGMGVVKKKEKTE